METQTAGKREKRMKLRSHLISLVVVAILPVLIFAGCLVTLLAYQQLTNVEVGLRGTTRALTSALDEKIRSIVSSLEVLAVSEDFDVDARKLSDLHRRIRRIVQEQNDWHSFVLVDNDGKQLLNTSRNFTDSLPSLEHLPAFRQALTSGRPAISGYTIDPTSKTKVIAVGVPVQQGSNVRFVLIGMIKIESLSRLFNSQGIPDDWTAAVLDSNSVLIARSRAPEQYVGRTATPILAKRSREKLEDVFQDVTQEGRSAYGVFNRSKATDWTVVLGIPTQTVQFPIWRVLGLILGGGLILLLVGIGLAILYGRRISVAIIALAESAGALGRREKTKRVESSVTEVNDVAIALETAAQDRDRSEEDRRALYHIISTLAGELDLTRLLQKFIDEATALIGAGIGAYFHTTANDQELKLYTLSGVQHDVFTQIPAFQKIARLGPALSGECVVRCNDITKGVCPIQDPSLSIGPDGHPLIRSYLAVPVASRTGETLGVLFFGHHQAGAFTERHEQLLVAVAAQAAVAIDSASLYQQAQEAIQLRDTFLSMASHELKTPLTTIDLQMQVLKLELMSDSNVKDKDFEEAADRVRNQIKRMIKLVDEFLDVSRISAGRLELHPEKVDLGQLVREVTANFAAESQRTGSELTLRESPHIIGDWDRGRLEQIFTNLISNAIKYGAGQPIEISISTQGKWAIVAVHDSGPGIANEDQQRIFQRFERAVSNQTIGGLGLGLWIVRQIVDALGGSITLESTPGSGSTFSVFLPL